MAAARREPTTGRNPLTGPLRPRDPPHLRVAGGYPPQAGFVPRMRKDPARRFVHPRGPCLTCGQTFECTAPLEEDAFVLPRPTAFHLREEHKGRKEAVAWLPRAPRYSPARQVSPHQCVSQTGCTTPPLPPPGADAATAPPKPQSSPLAVEASVNGRCSMT